VSPNVKFTFIFLMTISHFWERREPRELKLALKWSRRVHVHSFMFFWLGDLTLIPFYFFSFIIFGETNFIKNLHRFPSTALCKCDICTCKSLSLFCMHKHICSINFSFRDTYLRWVLRHCFCFVMIFDRQAFIPYTLYVCKVKIRQNSSQCW
jgi:hypothetical protein